MKIKSFFISLFAFTAAFLIATSAAFAAGEGPKERYIVKLKAGERVDIATQSIGAEKIGDLKIIGAFVVDATSSEINSVRNLPGVEYVEKDIKVYALDSVPWGVARVGAPAVWASGNTGAGIKVAVLDTGVDYTHTDISGVYAGGTTFVSGTTTPMDDNGHGTHVSGSIAAAYNGVGLVGVAPGVRLYGVKVLNSAGSGYVSGIIQGIDWAIANGMQVVSMSFGTSSYLVSLDDAIKRADAAGIVLVAAAGNSGAGADTVNYPAKFPQVIAVAATDSGNIRASFSSTGPAVSLAAPGVSTNSTIPGNAYALYSGTSMATPHVSGVAALLLSTTIPSGYDLNGNGKWDPREVRNRLQDTATDLGASGKDNYYGYGLVNATAAVAVSALLPPPPSFDYSLSVLPASGSVVQGAGINTTVTTTIISGATESVSLSCAGLPSGASCAFYPAALLPTASSTLVILTSNSTPAGTQSISINAVSANGTSRNAPYFLSVSAPIILPANYSATFSRSGIASGTIWGVTVAGTRYNTSNSIIAVTGLSGAVNYSYDTIVPGTIGTRYPCNSGCFGTINSSVNVSAAYKTQYQLTMSADPASGGTTTPAVGMYWQDSGASVSISTSPALGYAFSSWSGSGNGSYSGTANAAGAIMNGPVSETANFQSTGSSAPYFSDDFESSGSWTASGLWHMTTTRASSPTHSYGYGNETTGNYRTKNSRNFGYLTSQPISLAGAVSPQLAFMSWYRTESGTAYDKKIVQISADGGSTWSNVKQISDTRSVWNSESVNLTAYAGKTVIIRFYFDTIDGYSNGYDGWFVDDVKISELAASSASAPRPVQGRAYGRVAGVAG